MQIIGLEIDGSSIHAALLSKKRKEFEVLNLQTFPLKPYSQKKDVKPLYMKELSGGKENIPVATGLSASEVLIRRLSLKTIKKKAILKTLPFQIESQSFLEPKEAITFPIIEIGSQESQVHCFTTTKKTLQKHLDDLQSYGVDPEYVSCNAMALARFAEMFVKEESSFLIFHIGMASCSCVLIDRKKPAASHAISYGIDTLLAAYKEERGKEKLESIDLLAPPKNSHQNFFREATKLKNEAAKTFYSLMESSDFPKNSLPLLITGMGKRLMHLEEFLAEGFGECFSTLLPLDIEPEVKQHAISLGLASNALTKDQKSLQFRQGTFIPKQHLRKLASTVLLFFLISFLAAASLYFYGRQRLNEEYENLSEQIHIAINKDAAKLKRPIPLDASSHLEDKIFSWQKIIQKETKAFPFFLKAPRVTDVLQWLSTHPILSVEKDIKLIDFHYELIKLPRLDNLQDPYLAKVALELRMPSHTAARMFHEALLKGDALVNPKLEIAWETVENIYKTSFFLKERGIYDKKTP